jgi:hypothetical protein
VAAGGYKISFGSGKIFKTDYADGYIIVNTLKNTELYTLK